MDVVAEVAERLIRFRVQAGLAPEIAAASAGIEADRLDDAEAAEIALNGDEIDRLARVYGIDPTEIFGGRITPIRDVAAGG